VSERNQLSSLPDRSFLEIGKIVSPQGLKGEVRVYPSSDFPERFEEPGRRWLLRPGKTEPEPIELVSGRYLAGKGLYVLQFAGVCTCDQAEALRNCMLLVPASDRPVLAADEFHILDLIGLSVIDQESQDVIGTVISVFSAGNDLLEVQRPDPADPSRKAVTVLIPFVKAIVPVVDLNQRRIEVTPPAGLIEPVE
jgi:16S rRNA processing protein RimM